MFKNLPLRSSECPKDYICPNCKKTGHYKYECNNEAVYKKRLTAAKKFRNRIEKKEPIVKDKKEMRKQKLKRLKEIKQAEEKKKELQESIEQQKENKDDHQKQPNNPDDPNLVYTCIVDPNYLISDDGSEKDEWIIFDLALFF